MKLDKNMSRAHRAVREVATAKDVNERTAAFVLAIQSVGGGAGDSPAGQ